MKKDPTLWQVMSGHNRDVMAGRAVLPVIIAVIYGMYKLFSVGASTEHWLYTYVPLLGGIASIISIMAFSAVVLTHERNVRAMLKALSGFIAYGFSLYLMGFLGVYGIWQSISPLSIWGVLAGVFWIVLGYEMLRKFWIVTELASMPASTPLNEMEHYFYVKAGMKPRELLPLLRDEKVQEVVFDRDR